MIDLLHENGQDYGYTHVDGLEVLEVDGDVFVCEVIS
jgi:hypothetical protein